MEELRSEEAAEQRSEAEVRSEEAHLTE